MNKLAVLALGVAFAGMVTTATAQETDPIGLSVRAGIFLPTDSNAQDESDLWFAAGLEYKLKDMSLGDYTPGYTSHISLSWDWYESGDYRQMPLLVNYVGHKDQLYYSIGAGIGFTKLPAGFGDTDDKTTFAYSVGVGYEFQQGQMPVFLEARYFGSTESELNGLAFYVGVRL